jgi:hypothetical protein
MPKVKTTQPAETKEKGQRSLQLAPYLQRYIPYWAQPEWLEADLWRKVIANQPIAVICRETLLSYINSLEWKIEARDSKQRDELKEEVKYHTRLFEENDGMDYIQLNEWVGKDLLDIPFGGGAELIRESEPDGKVRSIIPVDGGTCFPTLSKDYPVGQKLKQAPNNPVYFPSFAFDRIFMSPRTEISRAGWGMPPAEKIYLSIELLNRGDRYYANLLLDTPPVGILDFMDFAKEDVEEWTKAWKELLTGIDPYKVPILSGHEKAVSFISFSRSPTELMFDKATMKYAALCAAGYGMSLSDIGFQSVSSGGETLAGSIRDERKTKRTGFSTVKKKFELFRNRMLPDSLVFRFIDQDDETSVAMGRARLADSTAAAQYVDKRIFSPSEMRLQAIADGLITVSVPEEIPPDSEFPQPQLPTGGSAERPSMLGRPVAATAGGQGEVRQSLFEKELDRIVNIEDVRLKRLIRASIIPIAVEISALNENNILEDDNLQTWNEWHDEVLWGDLKRDIPELTLSVINDAMYEIDRVMAGDEWWVMCAESKEIAKDLHTDFDNLRISKLRSIAEEQYELGIINAIPTEFPKSISLSKKFNSRVNAKLTDIWDTLPVRIKKAVISGTRKYLSAMSLIGSIDFEHLQISTVNVTCVRNELVRVRDEMVTEFAETISSIINNILGEIKWQEDDQNQNQKQEKLE